MNDPVDRGGATNYGIIQRTYDPWRRRQGLAPRDVREITMDEVHAVYREDYWLKGKCDALPWPASLAHFDSCVNHGVRNAAKLLQRVVGAKPDGAIGAKTMAAIEAMPAPWLTNGLHWARVRFYLKIVAVRPSQIKFLRGWLTRVIHLLKETGVESVGRAA